MNRYIASLVSVLTIASFSVGLIGVVAQTTPSPATPSAAPTTPVVTAPAAISAPAPAPFQPGKPAVEKIDNPYGLKALWAEGDLIAKTTLVILVIMSVTSRSG